MIGQRREKHNCVIYRFQVYNGYQFYLLGDMVIQKSELFFFVMMPSFFFVQKMKLPLMR